jgi:hypothetical protein
MAYKVTINDDKNGFNFQVKYENLSKLKRPAVEARNPAGDKVQERTTYNGQVLPPGSTQRQWVDDKGTVYNKADLTFWYEGEQVQENAMTKVFSIEGYQSVKNYTDTYIIGTYYELYPHDNDLKKDWDRERARIINLGGMKKLWDYLDKNQLVARGEFCVSSKGFLASDGYIRAIKFGNKWGLEIGVFREEKIFEHLQEEIPEIPAQAQGKKKLKAI